MSVWYWFCDLLPLEMLHWDFMKNALLAILLMAPLFGLMSTMIVTGRMSFFLMRWATPPLPALPLGASVAQHSLWVAVTFSVAFALLFSFVRSRSNQAADTLIGVFSSTAVALGIFIATLNGGSFTKYNKYLIGDILSITPAEIGALAVVFVCVAIFWVLCSNRLALTSVYPQLASSRGISVHLTQAIFTTGIAVVVTLTISSVGLILNSLLVLPAAASRNVSRNMKQYHFFSVLFALIAGLGGLICSYYLETSAGAAISLALALIFAVSFCLRKARA